MATFQQVLWNIDLAAESGAQASLDAHGEFVAPEIVWSFLRTVYQDTEGEVYPEMDILPEGMPRQFQHDYARHCRILMEKRAK